MSFNSSSCPESPLFSHCKSIEKVLRSSSKRKLLLSPSKDLMIFFDNKTFTKFNPINPHKDQKTNTKLTLDRKNKEQEKNSTSKNLRQSTKKPHKIHSVTNSTESFNSNKNSNREKDEKFARLKQQVDQIRRKYSYSKLGPTNGIKKTNSTELLRVSTEVSTINNSKLSLNNSKEKIQPLTTKNDRYLGKKILTRNVFSQKPVLNLRSKQHLTKTLKLNTNQSQEIRRKGSYEFQNMISSVNLNFGEETSSSKMFQFTFGSMALMDFQSKDCSRVKSKRASQ